MQNLQEAAPDWPLQFRKKTLPSRYWVVVVNPMFLFVSFFFFFLNTRSHFIAQAASLLECMLHLAFPGVFFFWCWEKNRVCTCSIAELNYILNSSPPFLFLFMICFSLFDLSLASVQTISPVV
jgi:hypothetical protein